MLMYPEISGQRLKPTASLSRRPVASMMVTAWTAASRFGGLGTGYFTLEGSGLIGHCSIFNDIVPPRADFSEWLTVRLEQRETLPLSTADIAYWGHHPVADMVCRFEAKQLELGIRAFAPLILGNSADSNIPAALFEIEIRNTGKKAADVELQIVPPQAPGGPTHDVALAGEDINVAHEDGKLVGRIARTIEANGSVPRTICIRLAFTQLARQQQ